MDKTQWYPASVKPVREGVYEREFAYGAQFCKWDGKNWYRFSGRADFAENETEVAGNQNLRWRGLAEPAEKQEGL